MNRQTKRTLFDITTDLAELLDNGFNADFVDEDGEIDEERVAQAIDGLEIEMSEKVDGVANYIQETLLVCEGIKAKKEALNARQKALERRAERLEQYLTDCLRRAGYAHYETVTNAISFRASDAVKITDESLVPEEYKTVKTTETVDKAKIKSAIKLGLEIPGAEIEKRTNIIIR